MSTEYTGERFLPAECSGEIAIEHYQRYQFANQLVKDKYVLDAACGEGYGSSLLAREAAYVVGLDLDETVVMRANEKYGTDRLSFQCGSIEKLPFADHFFDVIVSYETIEHVKEEVQINFLDEIQRVLKPDGVLIISTPNKAIYTERVKGQNPFHLKEFYVSEFQKFLANYFVQSDIYCQYPDLGYFITKEGCVQKLPDKKEKLPEESRYIIAVCSNVKKIYDIKMDTLSIFDDQMYYDLNRYVHEKDEQILQIKKEAEAFQEQLEEEIRKQKEYIAKLEKDYLELKNAWDTLTIKFKHPVKYLMEKMKRK